MTTPDHVGELRLRRLFAGELTPAEQAAVRTHTEGCTGCLERLRQIETEQARFEQQIPFERFAAGVERAARRPSSSRSRVVPFARWAALAATVTLGVVVGQRLLDRDDRPTNRLKGANVDVVVAPAGGGPQRLASDDPRRPELLAAGDRVRIGYRADGLAFVTAFSIDHLGEITPLYPEHGSSLRTAPGPQPQFLADSIEFTGQGTERLVVVLSERAFTVDEVKAAARTAFEAAGGDLARLEHLALPGAQFHRSFQKP